MNNSNNKNVTITISKKFFIFKCPNCKHEKRETIFNGFIPIDIIRECPNCLKKLIISLDANIITNTYMIDNKENEEFINE